jgi:hypothetical protein
MRVIARAMGVPPVPWFEDAPGDGAGARAEGQDLAARVETTPTTTSSSASTSSTPTWALRKAREWRLLSVPSWTAAIRVLDAVLTASDPLREMADHEDPWPPPHPETPTSPPPRHRGLYGEGELVFDPFCGSGTTGVAAKELGRFFVGAEMEREHVELAARRIWTAERGEDLRGLPASNMDKYALTGQRLRAIVRDEPGRDLCGDEPPDVEEASPCMTLLARFLSLSRSSFHGRRLTV